MAVIISESGELAAARRLKARRRGANENNQLKEMSAAMA